MQNGKRKIYLAVKDGVRREVLLQSFESRFPGAVEIYDGATGFHPGDAPAVLLADSDVAGFESCSSVLVLCLGHAQCCENCINIPEPIRLGDVLFRIARHFSRDAWQNVTIGPWDVYPGENRLVMKDGKGEIVHLTEKECHILLSMYGKKGGIIDRQELLDEVWGYAAGVETHTLETHIYRLRQKIEADPAKPKFLLTEGSGYKLAL